MRSSRQVCCSELPDKFEMTSTSISVRISLVTLSVAAVAGCSSLPASDPTLDYKKTSTGSQRPLDVPPELSPLPQNDRYVVPERPSALSAMTKPAGAGGQQPQAASATVALSGPNARIERAGAQRWLSVDVPPEVAFAVVQELVPTLGLKIDREDAALGIVETEWAENRAKLPQDVIRRTLGRLVDSLYSTREQDKYRIRVERTAKDTAEIFVSHRGMIEVFTGSAQEHTKWQPRPSDDSLEAELLQRLLVRFVQPKTPATKVALDEKLKAEKATAATAATTLTRVVRSEGQARVEISEPFDRAWRRVGLALDRGGFTVEDRDRAKGFYYVRYLDPEYEAREREKQGLFSKFFGREYKVEAQQFRVLVQAVGEVTQISVQDRDGKPDQSDTAAKIIKQLGEQMR